MSQLLIQQYLNQLSTLKKVSGSQRESVLREAFKDLLKGWARSRDLHFIPEYEIESKTKERRYVDGALLYELRVPFGYWEAKDAKDDLDAMVEEKFKRGYPQDNIIFENNVHAVLIQNREEVMRAFVDDVKGLEKLLNLFFSHERKEIADFRHAVEQFKTDLPAVLEGLRVMIDKAHAENAGFRKAAAAFLVHAQETINPTLGAPDVREMLIQHILTEEIFSAVFPGTSFHKDNNVARELYKLEGTFFTGNTKFKTLKGLEPYYASIRSAAAQIASHHEKQTFLKVIYENFYKVYNKKAADRLGVVYTPNEIVRFMIESADWLCEKHFGRNLIDKEVDILDPATGTGTFICELLEHFRGQSTKLKHKYKRELHANEVAILPYYVANLNIEATYAAITGEYEEFPNLCFVDTLDNVAGLRKHAGHVDDLFGGVTDTNIKRIREQNSRRISVVIGNPPYNANQLNENENNKNREYPEIDKRIRETYIDASTAQKTKLYDMYARFLRWASDRVDENGIVAFVSNRSFIDSRTFDGFRKCVAREFNEIRIVDLKGNARTSGEQRRKEGGNIFDDQIRVGIAVYFMIRKKKMKGCRIYYEAIRDYAKADEKREFLRTFPIASRKFNQLQPDSVYNWIGNSDNDFGDLIPLVSKATDARSKASSTRSIFRQYANAIKTNRDEWVYDFSVERLLSKSKYLVNTFNRQLDIGLEDADGLDYSIKWSSSLKTRRTKLELDRKLVVATTWRPFVSKVYYAEKDLSDRLTVNHYAFYGADLQTQNVSINIQTPPIARAFHVLATRGPTDYHAIGDTTVIPRSTVDAAGNSASNISEWAIDQFRKKYQLDRGNSDKTISKEAIFHYVYAVLHDPIYREKYVLNLKREFPRIPMYRNFWQWSGWGKELMDLHIGYESINRWSCKRTDKPDERVRQAGQSPKAILKADKEAGRILLDSETTLEGVPPEAWVYTLGNRSALEWILDQYKESKPKDPTIREKFDTYRFADYKEKVVDLLARVTTVSVETQRIVEAMKKAQR
jgi:predicted helicase